MIPRLWKKISLILFFSLIPASICFSAQPLDVVINEIAWMGTETSGYNEWIELYNSTKEPIHLKGWKLISKDNILEIELKGKINNQDFFILERTDDNTRPDIKADLVYTGTLSNKGEYLQLIDNYNNIIDEVNCINGWFAGNNNTKQTMERKNHNLNGLDVNAWQTSQNSEGSLGETNTANFKDNKKENGISDSLNKNLLSASRNKIESIQTRSVKSFISDFLVGLSISLFFSALILLLKRIICFQQIL